MEIADTEIQLSESLQHLQQMLNGYSNGQGIVTSKFLYQIKEIIEASKMVVETTKIITREIFLKEPALRNELVSLSIEIVDAYIALEKLTNTLKYNLMDETTPSVVMSSCEIIALNSATILHIFNGSSFTRLFSESHSLLEKLDQVTPSSITNYTTSTIIAEIAVQLHTHLTHLLTQVNLSTDEPHQLHSLHHLLSDQYATFISAFDEYLISNKTTEKAELVFKACKELSTSLKNEIHLISPVHPLPSRPWKGTRLRATELLKSEDFEGITPILLKWDFPTPRVLPLIDSLEKAVRAGAYDSADDTKVELLEYFQQFATGGIMKYQEDPCREQTAKMLQLTLHKFESKYWKFKDKRDVGFALASLEETLVPSSLEEDIVIQEIKEIGECLRYGTLNSLYLLPKYSEKLRFLGAPKVTIGNIDSIQNISNIEELQEFYNNLPPLPDNDALLVLKEMVIELIILDILLTSPDYHNEQFEYLTQRVVHSVTKITRSSLFLAYLIENPFNREICLLAAKSIEQSITDIALFLNELVRVKIREERDWVVKQDIVKFIRGVEIIMFYSQPPPIYHAYNLVENIVRDAEALQVYQFANISKEVEFRIKENYEEFKICVHPKNCNSDLLSPSLINEFSSAIELLDDTEIKRIGTEILKLLKKHHCGDLIRVSINVATMCAQQSCLSVFEKTYDGITNAMKAFTLDEQFLFKQINEEFVSKGRAVVKDQSSIEEMYNASTRLRKALDNCFIVDEVNPLQSGCREVREVMSSVQSEVVKLIVPDVEVKKMYKKLDEINHLILIKNWTEALESELVALLTIYHGDKDLKGRIITTLQLLELLLDFFAQNHVLYSKLENIKRKIATGLIFIKWGYSDIVDVIQEINEVLDEQE
ncbi:hypothetical protein EHI8A_025630 [Entamoeba histolytica HM-1:IMSS-B]|uniref:Uncharacterized protein n=6 Tax=Entamoeba histolytica TaxID=5759 RepID=C4M7Q2_ENTH1|nr:hypothetical protein EHI_120860 [Entamoeba histolytica HM-1:IMSS]EMD43503.1 Hypothetical protein EHI5A_054610 [Entamoeba histolytica KU27]EMH75924.1 hypothetical protein EHI8A_025630 [Entamoeba histolytica HM-1:IMSS-B]EMS16674.1 hypothetical protein KM1_062640 [Entamoeba histolytica HM-3:IMSS]ENY65355.1 hypothetical protein EHI7A_028470 [Entamoeba histolytica HM-1:IMSS-A]GAT97578.1 hypothetical protein CL6EHI_120860 [Entamoeba histolytica]|eukprot:XP_654341.1 hypothetical protein EHI_120860 [Entamoeba histolytica HM-1:IMSS]